MNQLGKPLPITMPYDKYKDGTRDYIPYNEAKLPDSIELKDIFDFITSDDPRTKIDMQDGSKLNYLPTKNFKTDGKCRRCFKIWRGYTRIRKSRITDSMQWKFPGEYLTRDNLALIDILAHNNWKRPICFTATMNK